MPGAGAGAGWRWRPGGAGPWGRREVTGVDCRPEGDGGASTFKAESPEVCWLPVVWDRGLQHLLMPRALLPAAAAGELARPPPAPPPRPQFTLRAAPEENKGLCQAPG